MKCCQLKIEGKTYELPDGLPGLRPLRQDRDMTMEQLAQEIEVVSSTIYAWEKGRANPQGDQLRKLCLFFNVTPDSLMLQLVCDEPEATITHLDGHQVDQLEPAEAPGAEVAAQ